MTKIYKLTDKTGLSFFVKAESEQEALYTFCDGPRGKQPGEIVKVEEYDESKAQVDPLNYKNL